MCLTTMTTHDSRGSNVVMILLGVYLVTPTLHHSHDKFPLKTTNVSFGACPWMGCDLHTVITMITHPYHHPLPKSSRLSWKCYWELVHSQDAAWDAGLCLACRQACREGMQKSKAPDTQSPYVLCWCLVLLEYGSWLLDIGDNKTGSWESACENSRRASSETRERMRERERGESERARERERERYIYIYMAFDHSHAYIFAKNFNFSPVL